MNLRAYELQPLEGVLPVRFGMTPAQVQALFSDDLTDMTSTAAVQTYHDGAFAVYFDERGVNAIHLKRSREFSVHWNGADLLHTPAADVLAAIDAQPDGTSPDFTFSGLLLTLERAAAEGPTHDRFFSAARIRRPG